jgi:DNA repair exonuclease SbcCD ATPase subunit
MYNQRVEEAGRKMWSRLQESNATELLRCLENRAERSEERKACTQRLVELEDDYLKYLSELPKAGTVTKCPSCSCSVTVVTTSEGSNIFLGSDVDEKAKNIVRKLTPAYKEYVKTKSRLEDLNEDIPLIFEGEIGCGSVTSPEWTLQSLQKYIRENVQAEAVYKTPFQPSGTLVALKKKVAEAEACKGRFSLLKAETTCVVDEVAIGEVRHAVLVEENKRVVYIPLAKKKSEIEKVLENKNLEFGELNFEKLKSDLVDARTALTTAFEAKILWDEYRTYVDAMERRSSAEHVVKEANELFFKSDSELQTAIKLKAIILEAESASLESVVSTLNMHAQTLLETFFPKNPISVSLVTFKDAKNGKEVYKKPTIDVQVEYKGNETDIGSLSGGERARVALAYTLGLAELQGSKILMLDESISSLDYEATVDVLEALKCNDRPIICISHQANTGMFDSVVTV